MVDRRRRRPPPKRTSPVDAIRKLHPGKRPLLSVRDRRRVRDRNARARRSEGTFRRVGRRPCRQARMRRGRGRSQHGGRLRHREGEAALEAPKRAVSGRDLNWVRCVERFHPRLALVARLGAARSNGLTIGRDWFHQLALRQTLQVRLPRCARHSHEAASRPNIQRIYPALAIP